MSTTINPDGFPDADALQEMANQFFKALPDDGKNNGLIPDTVDPLASIEFPASLNTGMTGVPNHGAIDPDFIPYHLFPVSAGGAGISPAGLQNQTAHPFSNAQYHLPVSQLPTDKLSLDQPITPQTTVPDNRFTSEKLPQSVAGSGVSPSAIRQNNSFNSKDPQTSLPDPHFSEVKVPPSVAGSGISPSAAKQENSFNIRDPQTSLPDPHFKDGKVPQSVAGSGRQPSLQKNQPGEQSHHGTANPVETDLTKSLSSYNFYIPAAQLPVPEFGETSYYFLNQSPHSYSGQPGPVLTDNSMGKKRPAYKGITAPPFDVNIIRRDFPILSEQVNGRPLIWLDNAATTQKPQQVIDRISYFYEHENSNIHRAAHELAARATDAYEGAREKVRRFLNAASTNEIIFVRGATEAINLVAKSWGEQQLKPGDEIIISHLEHHANIVPWQQLAAKKGVRIRVIPVDDHGQLLLEKYAELLGPKTKLVAFTQVSNALGTITPAAQIIAMAHAVGAKVLLDGAQSVSHLRVDMQALDADWFVFSGHKVFAPTGIGVLYGKEELLNATEPWQSGGNMILDVTFEQTKYHQAPGRFEAGTGNIADAVGLGAALDYVSKIGIDLINQYEHYLLMYGTQRLLEVPGLRLIGTAREKASVLSFVLDGFTNDETGKALNREGIAVRTGHHCAQPILRRFGLESSVRPSLAFYNTCADLDTLVAVLLRLRNGHQ